ncbi:PR2 [Drosophila busckii]|uniref:non-specific protein-tyrosine kinase n=1 Tax=Drosophila busckii TaxID=30019 RepID=A0A0M4ETG0_DROBS|nr:PR2 [Drosophila busckii]
MECPQIDLYEFLTESELQQYYNAIKNELKITNAAQFKYAADEDLRCIGLSRPEIRRLRKFYEKHFPHSYLSKIKRLLQAPATIVKREDGAGGNFGLGTLNEGSTAAATATASRNGGADGNSPGSKVPNNKHIIPADSISVNKQLGIGEFGIVQQGVWTNGSERKDHLLYRQGDIITVLDRNTGTPFWKGVLSTGKTGYFNPSNTVAFLEGLPSSNRDAFSRVGDHRISKRKLRTEMISKPQNDFKHTGHVGIDGATFGDIAFLGSSQNYNHVPKQIVTPYKPSEDIEQTPLLLPPTPTSPDSLQTASGYFPEGGAGSSMNPTFIPSTEHTPKLIASNGQSSFDFASSTNPFASHKLDEEQLAYALQNNNYPGAGADGKSLHSESHWRAKSRSQTDELHEYHEISDDEITGDKLDFGPSLLDEINSMFGSISGASGGQPKSPDFDRMNTKNEFAELSAKFGHKSGDSNGNKHGHSLLPSLSKKKTSTGTVKPISVKDEKILNHAIEMANEISARSMIDLVSDHAPPTHSPKRKFSFRFPHLSGGGGDKSSSSAGGASGNLTPTHGTASPFSKKKNFTEELQSIPDIQQRFRSLSEIKHSSELRVPIFDKESSDFLFEKSREILSRPLNRQRGLELELQLEAEAEESSQANINENIMDIEKTLKALNLDFMHTYTELDKSDSNETMLNDQLPSATASLRPGSLDDGIGSASGSLKSAVYSYSYSNGVQTMFDFNAATSHLDKHLQYMHNQAQLQGQQLQEQKLLEDKRSSTPDTGFASRDTNISLSRRSSQKSSYSPQESYFSMKGEPLYSAPPVVSGGGGGYERFGNGHTKQLLASASPVKSALGASSNSIYTKSYRQRSTSFNESFQPPPSTALPLPMPLPRRSASYKPRSVRARTLRRLSYNPMTLDSSSSSSSGDEAHSSHKPSLARSECDIRARVAAASSSSSLCRRRRPGLSRQVQSACQDERESIVSPRQLYGSNSSIKSAPHYNLGGNRRSFQRPSGYEQFHYEERIYDFGGRGPGNNYAPHQQALLAPSTTQKLSSGSGSSSAASSAVATYRSASAAVTRPMSGGTTALHEFDITRLTGKSPTSSHFVGSSPDAQPQSLPQLKPQRPTEFHWPEKIHASALKQHELHWRPTQQQLPPPKQLPLVTTTAIAGSSDSSSSSSTESGDEFQFRRDDGREAYNSLIERKGMLDIGPSPAATLLRHMDTDEFELMNAKTLPRRLGSQLSQPVEPAPLAAAPEVRTSQQPPRPMTLPTRGAVQRVRRAEQASSRQQEDSQCNSSEACESPSYLTHASYKFPEPADGNPLPLPSREGKKQVKTSAKRHVRKYPLIIPANGVQRTLSKLTDFAEEASQPAGAEPAAPQHQQQQSQSTHSLEVVAAVRSNSVRRRTSEAREYENMPALAGESTGGHTYQNLDKLTPADAAGLTDSASLQFESILEADKSRDAGLQSPDVTDGFYNFSIQKEHYHKSKDVGFEPAQISGLYVNDDELRNLDKPLAANSSSSSVSALDNQGTVPPTESVTAMRLNSADNELAANALFKKVRASVNLAMNRSSFSQELNGNVAAAAAVPTAVAPAVPTSVAPAVPTAVAPAVPTTVAPAAPVKQQTEAEYFASRATRLADSNSVSCEDLLEFSDKKPRGCERGVDSDEVRIMVKVLGKDSTPTRCLSALEFINWDVHKSIKLIKLQNILAEANLSLSAAFDALHQQDWDLHTTAVKLKGIKL